MQKYPFCGWKWVFQHGFPEIYRIVVSRAPILWLKIAYLGWNWGSWGSPTAIWYWNLQYSGTSTEICTNIWVVYEDREAPLQQIGPYHSESEGCQPLFVWNWGVKWSVWAYFTLKFTHNSPSWGYFTLTTWILGVKGHFYVNILHVYEHREERVHQNWWNIALGWVKSGCKGPSIHCLCKIVRIFTQDLSKVWCEMGVSRPPTWRFT